MQDENGLICGLGIMNPEIVEEQMALPKGE